MLDPGNGLWAMEDPMTHVDVDNENRGCHKLPKMWRNNVTMTYPHLTLMFVFTILLSTAYAQPKEDVLVPYEGPSVLGADPNAERKSDDGLSGLVQLRGDEVPIWAGPTGPESRKKPFAPGNVSVDLWPDTTDYDADELFSTGFKYADGTTAKVFSSHNRKTVIRHFKWMADYGIDGAFVQRFAHGLRSPETTPSQGQGLVECTGRRQSLWTHLCRHV